MPRCISRIAVLACGAALAACANGAPPKVPDHVALFTSLPVMWRETTDIRDLLASDAKPHWALDALGGPKRVRALDTLAGNDGKLEVASGTLLVMAQPRPLSPQENVALDEWVRGGGHVLLFADPMLTADSAYAIGDRRRPEDVAMLSPILRRWGLDLQFDEDQPAGEHLVAMPGGALPVNLPGSFALRCGASGCTLGDAGIWARCSVGAGSVLAIADAALFEEPPQGVDAGRPAMVRLLLAWAADGPKRSPATD